MLLNDADHHPIAWETWYIYAVTIGGPAGNATMRGYLNGARIGEVTGLTVGWGNTQHLGQAGAVNDGNMDLAEILLYDRVLSDAELLTVTTYLGEKFGISCK